MTFTGLKTVAGAIAAAVVLAASAPSAMAQQKPRTPVIAVINYTAALAESDAGKSVRAQIEKQRDAYQAEIKAMQTKLEQAREELSKQQQVLAPEVFAKKRQEYQQQAEEVQRAVQRRKRQLDTMRAKGFTEIQKALQVVVEGLAKERGYDIILNVGGPGGGAIVYAVHEFIITEEAVKRLNKALPNVTVSPEPE